MYPAQPRQASSIPSKNGTGTESCSHRYFDLAGSPVIRWGWHSLASWLVLEGVDVSPRCRVIAISNQNQARNLESRVTPSVPGSWRLRGSFSTRCSATRRSNIGTKSGMENGAAEGKRCLFLGKNSRHEETRSSSSHQPVTHSVEHLQVELIIGLDRTECCADRLPRQSLRHQESRYCWTLRKASRTELESASRHALVPATHGLGHAHLSMPPSRLAMSAASQ